MPRRMSVRPTASQTRTLAGNAIIAVPAHPAPDAGGGLHRRTDPNAIATGELDLYRIGRRRGWCHFDPIRRYQDRHKPSGRRDVRRVAVTLTPTEDQVGVDVILPRDNRHGSTRRQRCRHDLPLERFRPRPMPPSGTQTCVHYRRSGHFPPNRRHKGDQPPSRPASALGGPHRRDTLETLQLPSRRSSYLFW